MAISAPRRLLGKLISVSLSVLPNCECSLEFLGQCGMNFVCHNSIRPVSGYALLKKVVAWIIADIVVWNGEPKWGADTCHEIIEARRGNHLQRLAKHYGRLNRGIPVPPLSHFFPGPPLIIGSTSDGPSSDFDDTTDALPTVYAVTEEIPSGVHIRPAQENEELNNWTSVLRYSAVIADV
ncbi:hypothetical protein CDL15_Pgr005267 [Punica granatum]|uniref:Uncharacterized protein n=1 Tax=Punica granatum TaxID=22663 RepID=A0A218XYZ7_PUNGR|nr:hypothetical protein CDL15_Pgr005267 [Punica granatum]